MRKLKPVRPVRKPVTPYPEEVEEALVSYHAAEESTDEGTLIQRPLISSEQAAEEVRFDLMAELMEEV